MDFLQALDIGCAYCGETITILVDASAGSQEYTEDCQVCCCPMVIVVDLGLDGYCRVNALREDES